MSTYVDPYLSAMTQISGGFYGMGMTSSMSYGNTSTPSIFMSSNPFQSSSSSYGFNSAMQMGGGFFGMQDPFISVMQDMMTILFQNLKTESVATDTETTSNKEESKRSKDTVSAKGTGTYPNFTASFDDMLGQVLGYEGGFSDVKEDRGGRTNYGITESEYRKYTGNKNANIKNITKQEVEDIYYNDYYVASGAKKYAENGDYAYSFAVFDAAVNHGVGAAKKMDNKSNGNVDTFMELRKKKYIGIVANNSSQKVFEKGWQNRWNKVYKYINPNHKYENYIA